jgi:hypothetical protein
MNSASRPIPTSPEPLAPRSLATLAAALVTCKHPSGSRLRAAGYLGDEETCIYWCAACGALGSQSPDVLWHAPTLTSAFTREAFEDLVLLLHAVDQLAQLARAHAPAGSTDSPPHIFLRNVSRSLSALSHLPVVREVHRLEKALARMPKSSVPPCR